MTTDILDLPDWTLIRRTLDGHEYELEAEYTVKPTACQKCGVLDRLYRHGTKDTIYRDSPIRGHATRILARVQRYKCRECGETFLQPLAGIQERGLTLVQDGLGAHPVAPEWGGQDDQPCRPGVQLRGAAGTVAVRLQAPNTTTKGDTHHDPW
jgi:transposase